MSSRSIFEVTYVCHCFHCSEMAKESIYGYVWIRLLSISGQNQVKQGFGVVTKQLFIPVPHFTPLYCIWYIYILYVYILHTVEGHLPDPSYPNVVIIQFLM